MANFVLVHGAWHGAWCWRRVTDRLTALGHRVHAVTLTGVGERAHLLTPDIHLSTHIQDVVATIDTEELQDVILAVHSYAGMVGTGVADLMPERLRHLVYVDAMVPKPGEAWNATHTRAVREGRLAAAQSSKICVNSCGALTMGSCPVAISMAREPGSHRPSQKEGSVTRGQMASMVASVGLVQRM